MEPIHIWGFTEVTSFTQTGWEDICAEGLDT